jgi:hypothetical protein
LALVLAWPDTAVSARAASDTSAPLPHRLEPIGRRVIHGAGQSPDEFQKYFAAIGDTKPEIYMTYLGLRLQPDDIKEYFFQLKKELGKYDAVYLIPEIGLSMTVDGQPDQHYEGKVARGEMDANIDAVCEGLSRLQRPAFVRIGYEFNGSWNGYQPDTYQAAWKRIVDKLRANELENVATIWCVGAETTDYMKYYPGDDLVDWWGIDLFSADQLSPKGFSNDFVQAASRHGFPVIIGESTPRYIGVLQGEASWNQWFVPYFAFIAQHENVKAFCYISWDWGLYPQWKDWGDARITSNPVVLDHYKTELAKTIYIHGTDQYSLQNELQIK